MSVQTKSTSVLVFLLSAAAFIGWSATRIVAAVRYEQQIGGHLKRAADSNSIALASVELESALAAMDARELCDEPSYTSVLYRTPDEDVSFWCANIRAAHDDLRQAESTSDDLTESNMLIKVRESLLDHGEHGDTVTAPEGISVYPYNVPLAWWGVLSLCGVLSSVSIISREQ